MPELSFHEVVTVALFLSTLLFLAIASFIAGGNASRAFALIAVASGAAASIGIATQPAESTAWDDRIPPRVARNAGHGGAGAGGGAGAQGQATGGGAAKQAAAEAGNGGDEAGDEAAGGAGATADKGFVRASYRPAAARPGAKGSDPGAFRDCPHCPEMVTLKPGYAQLGGIAADPRTGTAELPQRIVRLAKPFAIGRTEITVAQYSAFIVASGRAAPQCAAYAAASGDKPAECISFADARAYVDWLSQLTHRTYRLPSASEWEYAARAGSGEAYPGNDVLQPEAANIGPSAGALKAAGSFPANGFGLRDMVGSLAEIVADCWVSNLKDVPTDGQPAILAGNCARRTLKDAAWWELPVFARVSARRPLDLTTARPGTGFRVVGELN